MGRTACLCARRLPAARCIFAFTIIAAGVLPAQALHWRELLGGNQVCAGMAYDAARARFVTFAETSERTNTREWGGTAWRVVPTAHTPGWRAQPALVYDRARNRTLLFGGYTAQLTEPRDLWEYDGFDWKQRQPAVAPAGRHAHALAYDRARGRTVLFGGLDLRSLALFGDTWEWDGQSWSRRSNGGPSPRHSAAMAGHAASGRTVLFGGATDNAVLGDTWTWDGVAWSLANPASPPLLPGLRRATADDARNVVVLFGNLDPNAWEWDGANWNQVPAAGPPPRDRFGMATDDGGATLVTGGLALVPGASTFYAPDALGDTWLLAAAQWFQLQPTPPPAVAYPPADYDSGRDRFVLTGGDHEANATWEWDGSGWQRALPPSEPPALAVARLCYDRARGRSVLFGGLDESQLRCVDATWEWTGSRWLPRTVAGPPARWLHAMVYDRARGEVVLFGGSVAFVRASLFGDTWTWDGTAWRRRDNGGPAARDQHALAYDPARQRVVLFGGWLGAPAVPDTWEWDGAAWTQRAPAHSPAARQLHLMAFDEARARTVLVGGFEPVTGRDLQEQWEWDGADWSGGPAALPPTRGGTLVWHDRLRSLLLLRDSVMQIASPRTAQLDDGGSGCGVPAARLRALGTPVLGNAAFALDLSARAGAPFVLGVGSSLGGVPLGGDCTLYPGGTAVSLAGTTSAAGFASVPVPIPAAPALVGLEAVFQVGAPDPAAALGVQLSNWVRIVLGD